MLCLEARTGFSSPVSNAHNDRNDATTSACKEYVNHFQFRHSGFVFRIRLVFCLYKDRQTKANKKGLSLLLTREESVQPAAMALLTIQCLFVVNKESHHNHLGT